MKTRILAERHSATAFLNSLFLEWTKFEKVSDGSNLSFEVSLSNSEKLIIPIKKYSTLGRHHYTGEFFTEKNGTKQAINFLTLAHKIGTFLAEVYETSEILQKNFYSRLENSVANVEETLKLRSNELTSILKGDVTFLRAEQGLFIGHTFHPTPKSRGEFSDSDYQTYSAELGGHFPLEWLLVANDIYFEKISKEFQQREWATATFLAEFNNRDEAKKKLKEGYTPFPIHSWQKTYILKHPDIQSYLASNKIIELGRSDKEWFPTSSLRTLYASHAKYMLKFSMNVRLTNSKRNLLVHELDRGLQVHDVFSHKLGQEFLKSHSEFEVIYEPVYAGIKDKKGQVIQESLFVVRDNPFKENSNAIVLATLTQDDLEFGQNLIHHYIKTLANAERITLEHASLKWFKSFFDSAMKPLFLAQADYGILLGSHQQNMIVEIQDSLPVKSYFRDCNGTGYSSLGQRLFSEVESVSEENGNIFNYEVSNYLFGYYVVINSLFNTISSIAHSGWVTEEQLLNSLVKEVLSLKEQGLKDVSFIDYLLEGPTLMHKGNFLCCFKDINENTAGNPLSIYTQIPNPVFGRKYNV